MSKNRKNYIDKCIENAMKHKLCPNCNSELTTVINGEFWGEKARRLNSVIREHNLKIETFGVIHGDQRDYNFICRNCGKTY